MNKEIIIKHETINKEINKESSCLKKRRGKGQPGPVPLSSGVGRGRAVQRLVEAPGPPLGWVATPLGGIAPGATLRGVVAPLGRVAAALRGVAAAALGWVATTALGRVLLGSAVEADSGGAGTEIRHPAHSHLRQLPLPFHSIPGGLSNATLRRARSTAAA